MASTIAQDMLSIKAILDNDAFLNSRGFVADNIHLYNMLDDEITEDTKGIFIVSATPNGKADGVGISPVYEVSIVANRNQFGDVTLGIDQIVALLSNRNIGNLHILTLLDPPMNLSSPKGTFMYVVSFETLTPFYTPIRTI